jgi:hypothetical protein
VRDGLNLVFHVDETGAAARYATLRLRLEERKGGRQQRTVQEGISVVLWEAKDNQGAKLRENSFGKRSGSGLLRQEGGR